MSPPAKVQFFGNTIPVPWRPQPKALAVRESEESIFVASLPITRPRLRREIFGEAQAFSRTSRAAMPLREELPECDPPHPL